MQDLFAVHLWGVRNIVMVKDDIEWSLFNLF